MAGRQADGVYGRRAWTAPLEAAYPPQQYIGPFQSNAERLVSQSLAVNIMTGIELQTYVRPPLPQIKLFPDKYGYETSEIGVRDILQLSRYSNQRVNPDFSQTAATTQSSSRNTLGNSI